MYGKLQLYLISANLQLLDFKTGDRLNFLYGGEGADFFLTFFVKNQSVPDPGGRKIKSVPSLY